ncbi:GntR family transcriptional regulator [Bacteroides sp.]
MKLNESKYKLVVNHVIEGINEGNFKKGDWIPSINEFRKKYNLSRDTVFAGISELKSRGIIGSTPGVGYYIASCRFTSKHNIFLLFNEFNEFKEELYNSFVENIDQSGSVDIYFHNYNRKVFETLINEANGKYTTYILMPGKFQKLDSLLQTISGRVFLLDHYHPELKGKYPSVAQDFEKDTYEALKFGLEHIRKYQRIFMVQSEAKEPYERYDGLKKFSKEYEFECKYLNGVGNKKIKKGDLFMLVNDRDLVDVLKQAERQGLTPGKEFGIISYNDTPLKEILAGGITTLSTDFRLMGKTMALLINKKGIETIDNPWILNIRKSL